MHFRKTVIEIKGKYSMPPILLTLSRRFRVKFVPSDSESMSISVRWSLWNWIWVGYGVDLICGRYEKRERGLRVCWVQYAASLIYYSWKSQPVVLCEIRTYVHSRFKCIVYVPPLTKTIEELKKRISVALINIELPPASVSYDYRTFVEWS